jgi:hypothetical protein
MAVSDDSAAEGSHEEEGDDEGSSRHEGAKRGHHLWCSIARREAMTNTEGVDKFL